MFCSEIMTRNPECVTPNDSVMKAAQLMKSEDVGPIPIVKDGRKLEGIITDRDLALKVVAEGRDPKTTTVEAVMTDNLVTCKGNDDVQKVLTLMQKHQVRRIPVVDNEDQLIGIIAQADVATRLGNNSATGQMVEDISH
jgi:CBS domain-containing protein